MGIQNTSRALLNDISGQLWYIYSNGENLEYIIFHDDKIYETKTIIKGLATGFSVDMDKKKHVHLLCQSLSGQLIYLYFDGQKWDKQVLAQYDPLRYNMKYPVLKLYGSDIHVLFAMGNIYNAADWSLYHYYWHQNQWKTSRIGSLNIGRLINHFQIEFDGKGNIYILYRDKNEKNYQIYFAVFDADFNIWTSPRPLISDEQNQGYPAMLVYKNLIHLVWNGVYKNHVCVEYASLPLEHCKETAVQKPMILTSDNADAMHPLLSAIDKRLWVTWLNAGGIYSTYSDDNGQTWFNGNSLLLPENTETFCFRYIDPRFHDVHLIYGYMDPLPVLLPSIQIQSQPQPLATKQDPPKMYSSEETVTVQEAAPAATEKKTNEMDEIKARQADLLQLLIKAEQQYKQTARAIERLEQRYHYTENRRPYRFGIFSTFKQWWSK